MATQPNEVEPRVDLNARGTAAFLLQQFQLGKVQALELGFFFPTSQDPALSAAFKSIISKPPFRIPRIGDARHSRSSGMLERWSVFLRSPLPFEWPEPPRGPLIGLRGLLVFGFMFSVAIGVIWPSLAALVGGVPGSMVGVSGLARSGGVPLHVSGRPRSLDTRTSATRTDTVLPGVRVRPSGAA